MVHFWQKHLYNFGRAARPQMRPVPEVAAFENAALLTKICKDENVRSEPCRLFRQPARDWKL